MNRSRFAVRRVVVVLALSGMGLAGCRNLNQTENGALLGSALGAGAGAIIGHQSGNRDKGALIGGLTGAAAGGLIGNARQTAQERDEAQDYAQHADWSRRATERAMTNNDVVRMTQAGVDDGVILSTLRNRGGRFDTSPDSIIMLKQQHVSDRVIMAMQGTGLAH